MTTCRSCDAEVVFFPSATSGKPMILDRVPTKGVVVMPLRFDGDTITNRAPDGSYAEGPWASVVNVFTDHHATCPKADDWKGKRR